MRNSSAILTGLHKLMAFRRVSVCLVILCCFQSAGAQSVPVTVGYRDFYFGTGSTSEPTAEKPQSKLWWNDGFWWGSLWNPSTSQYEIHRFVVATQTWATTGTAIDGRGSSKADALWDGQRLYVVSQRYTSTAGPATPANSARLYRYSYNSGSKSYSLNSGFPVNVNSSTSETLVLDKDSTGQLWITWVESGKVKVNRSLGDDLTWGTPFDLPVQGNDVNPDDISTLVAFGGNRIGVLWSNQEDKITYFAVHRDSDADEVWQPREAALSDPILGNVSEDHLNLKATCDGSGDIYAVVQTNLSGSDNPGIFVLKRNAAGAWTRHVVVTANLNHSRPVVLINHENQRLYVFTRSDETGQSIVYMKSANLTDLEFPPGLGTPFIESATDSSVSNPTATKQCVNAATGILVLASDKNTRYYLHNDIDLINDRPSISSFTPANGPVGTEVTITGSHFTGTTRVVFNGAASVSFTVDSDTQVRAIVPAGAATGKISVLNAVDWGVSITNFTVTTPPVISSFIPANGPIGTEVTVNGSYFTGVTNVAFNGVAAASFIVDSNTQFRATVPTGATSGKISATNADGAGSSQSNFTVTSVPTISSFAPTNGLIGSEVTISGSNFTGVTLVTFSGVAASNFILDSNTQLRVTVPAGALTGQISVNNSAGTGSSLANFTVLHRLTVHVTGSGSVSVIPAGGVYNQGTTVTLTATPQAAWEFDQWDGDLDGSSDTATLVMDADKTITAVFTEIPQYTLNITVSGSGSVTVDPDNFGRVYYRGTTVTLTATPGPGQVFSGWSGNFGGWMNVETLTIDADKNLTATFSELPTPRFAGILTSAAELSRLPTSGLVWENLKEYADLSIGTVDLADKDNKANVRVLAKALTYARTGEETYRAEVIAACTAAMGTESGGRTLSLGRNLWAFVVAADLVGLPSTEEASFRVWLREVLSEDLEGMTLRSAHEIRPNNWGTHCGASRAAVAAYLGDATELERTARVFKGWLGDRNSYAGFSYGELDWQADPLAPVGINPLGATLNGHSVDGVLPDDQRRAGGFAWPPPHENYVYEALQGALAEAIVLYRAGYDVWNWENQALRRAFEWLYNEGNFPPEGDDLWLPHIINYYYQAAFPALLPTRPGKNAGWTDWLYGSAFALHADDIGSGKVDLSALGFTTEGLAMIEIAATPDSGYQFGGWSGDLGGIINPDTLIMDGDKSATAHFTLSSTVQYTLTLTTIGSGSVALNPPGGLYTEGTVVTLLATPASGFAFDSWSGSLSASANPAAITMNANKNVTAIFAESNFDETVKHEETKTGASSGVNTVTTSESVTGAGGDLYLTAISSKPKRRVLAVAGLGLSWTKVKAQCSGRNTTGIEVWMAQGTPIGNGTVTATLNSSAHNAVIAVSRYSGVAAQNPVDKVVSANTTGVSGSCSGGADERSYSFDAGATVNGSMRYVAVAMRNRKHTPGAGYTERGEIRQGDVGGKMAAVAVEDKPIASTSPGEVNGSFNGTVDWAAVAIEIKAQSTSPVTQFVLTVTTAGAGSVDLNPPGGTYDTGTVVTLTANPNSGFQFSGWGGDLSGAANPTTIAMGANKSVIATFAEMSAQETIVHEETKTGGSSESNTVTTSESVVGVSGHLYLAAVSTKPRVNVIAITGLGLNWTRVKAQCSGRNTTGIEVWTAQGTPIGNGTVTATLISQAHNTALTVSRYRGAATPNPLGNVASANTAGLGASCTDGADGMAYSFTSATTVNGAKIFAAVAMRNRTHTPGVGYTERGERQQGDLGGTMAAVAVQDRNVATAALASVSGEFNGTVDWAAVAIVIKPQSTAKPSAIFSDKAPTNEIAMKAGYRLYQNYPNPLRVSAFKPETEITYYLPQATTVRLLIFNMLGQQVRQLVNDLQAAGYQRARWDGKNEWGADLSAGIYFYQLEAGLHRLTGKLILQP